MGMKGTTQATKENRMRIKVIKGVREPKDQDSGSVGYRFLVCGRVSQETAERIIRALGWETVSCGIGGYFRHAYIAQSKTRTMVWTREGQDI